MQVAFKGYPGTLGATFVQHLITDRLASPPEYAALGYQSSSSICRTPTTPWGIARRDVGSRPLRRRRPRALETTSLGSLQTFSHRGMLLCKTLLTRTRALGLGGGSCMAPSTITTRLTPQCSGVDGHFEGGCGQRPVVSQARRRRACKSAAAHKVDPDRLAFSDFSPRRGICRSRG